MGWFSKNSDPVDRQLREIEKQLRQLEAQARQLRNSPEKALKQQRAASTTYPAHRQPPPASPAPPVTSIGQGDSGAVSLPEPIKPVEDYPKLRERERELWSRVAAPREERHRSANADWRAWLRLVFGANQRPSDPKLVSYLSSGSFKTIRPLRYERRMARYRYAFSAIILIGIVIMIVCILKNC